jgi:hypothetical protein
MVKPKSFRIWGRYEHGGNFHLNTMEIIYKGPLHIEFYNDKTRAIVYFPIFNCSNVNFGVRHGYFKSKTCVVYPSAKLKGFIDMDVKPKDGKFANLKDGFTGKIYNYDPAKETGINKEYSNVTDVFNDTKDQTKVLCKLQGGYMSSLEFEEKEYWNIKKHIPYKSFHVENPLPSDARFREDLLWLYYFNNRQSQIWKEELERVQKDDRACRKAYCKKHKLYPVTDVVD